MTMKTRELTEAMKIGILTPLHKSLNSSVKLPTQEMLRVTTLLMETVKS